MNLPPFILTALDRTLAWVEGHAPTSNRLLLAVGIAAAAILAARIVRKAAVFVLTLLIVGVTVLLIGRVLTAG
jgi:hypothetical protein